MVWAQVIWVQRTMVRLELDEGKNARRARDLIKTVLFLDDYFNFIYLILSALFHFRFGSLLGRPIMPCSDNVNRNRKNSALKTRCTIGAETNWYAGLRTIHARRPSSTHYLPNREQQLSGGGSSSSNGKKCLGLDMTAHQSTLSQPSSNCLKHL